MKTSIKGQRATPLRATGKPKTNICGEPVEHLGLIEWLMATLLKMTVRVPLYSLFNFLAQENEELSDANFFSYHTKTYALLSKIKTQQLRVYLSHSHQGWDYSPTWPTHSSIQWWKSQINKNSSNHLSHWFHSWWPPTSRVTSTNIFARDERVNTSNPVKIVVSSMKAFLNPLLFCPYLIQICHTTYPVLPVS